MSTTTTTATTIRRTMPAWALEADCYIVAIEADVIDALTNDNGTTTVLVSSGDEVPTAITLRNGEEVEVIQTV